MTWMRRESRLTNGAAYSVTFEQSTPPKAPSGSSLFAGLIVCDEPNPSFKPVYTGNFYLFRIDFLNSIVQIDKVENSEQTTLYKESVINALALTITQKEDTYHFAVNGKDVFQATAIPQAWFGLTAEAGAFPFNIQIRDLSEKNTAMVPEASLRQDIPKLAIMNYIPWHPSWSFIAEANDPGKDQPIDIDRSRDREKEYLRTFSLAASNGYDAVMVDIAVVKWWKDQMPMLKTMADVINKYNLPIKLITQIDTSAHTKPTVENVMPSIEYWLENCKDDPAFLHVDGKPVFFTFDTDSLTPHEWQKIFEQAKEKGLDAVWIAEFNFYHKSFKNVFLQKNPNLGTPMASKGEFQDYMRVFDGVYSFGAHPPLLTYSRMLADWKVRMPVDGRIIVGCDYPGYYAPAWKKGEANPRNGTELARKIWELNLKEDLAWDVITTWNEYNENTSIEPTVQNGGCLLALANYYNSVKKGTPALRPERTIYLTYKPERLAHDRMSYEVLNIPSAGTDYSYRLTVRDEKGQDVFTAEGTMIAGALKADPYTFDIPDGTRLLKPVVEITSANGSFLYNNLGNTVVLNQYSVHSDLPRSVYIEASRTVTNATLTATLEPGKNLVKFRAVIADGRKIENIYLYKNGTFVALNPPNSTNKETSVTLKATWPAVQKSIVRDGGIELQGGGTILSAQTLNFDREDRIVSRSSTGIDWISRGDNRAQDWDGVMLDCRLTPETAFHVQLGDKTFTYKMNDLPVSAELEDQAASPAKKSPGSLNLTYVDGETKLAPAIKANSADRTFYRPDTPPYLPNDEDAFFYIAFTFEDSTVAFGDAVIVPKQSNKQ